MTKPILFTALVALALACTVHADEGSAPAPPKACAAPEFRQFDFWLGDWNVADPKGGTGSSFNIYDATNKRWHQTWVDNDGTLLELEGGIVDGKMVLDGPGKGPKGEAVTNRIAWEKLADGRVRQTWTVSSDGGKTWTTAFDGYYSKK